MANGLVGLNATLGIGDGASPEAFTEVSEVVSIDGPSFSREMVDITHLNPPNDYAEFKAGLKDGGQVTIEGRAIPTDTTHLTGTSSLLGLFESGTETNFRITFPDSPASYFEFAALVSDLNPSIGGHSDPVNMSVTLKVTGKPTLTTS